MNAPSRTQSSPYGPCVSLDATTAPVSGTIARRTLIRARLATSRTRRPRVFGRYVRPSQPRQSSRIAAVVAELVTADWPVPAERERHARRLPGRAVDPRPAVDNRLRPRVVGALLVGQVAEAPVQDRQVGQAAGDGIEVLVGDQ